MEHVGKGYVHASGPKDALIQLVGDCPTTNEVKIGKGFQEGTGRILNSLLKSAGIDRTACRIDYAMRCQPPKGKIDKSFDPIICAQRHLFPELKTVKAHIIVALGATALDIICGLDKISKRRGSLYKTPYGKVLPTLHPSTMMRNQVMWFIVIADLRKAKSESLFPELIPPAYKFNKFPTLQQVKEFSPTTPLSVDIETSWAKYWENSLICIGFSDGVDTLCIPWLSQHGVPYWKPEEQEQVVREIQRLLSRPGIYQNGFFDVQVLTALGFEVKNFWFDTMLAHHLIYAELPHDLGFLCSVHTNVPYYKDESKSDAGALALTDEVFRGYNCKDVYSTHLASQDLTRDLRSTGNYDHFRAVTMKLPPILLDMQKRGIGVDTATLRDAIIEYTMQISQLNTDLEEAGVPKGDKALKEYLFVKLKLPVVKRSRKTKAPSLDADTFLKLHKKILLEQEQLSPQSSRYQILVEGSKALRLISTKKQKQKTLSTYLRGLPIGPDGRVHCSWLQHGTKNQRLSSRDPNLQNVPAGIARRIYCAKPGHKLYLFDYSQIELRIIAYEAEDLPLIQTFEEGKDPHDKNTRDFFGIKDGETYTERQRSFAKSFVYCLNYGGDVTAVLMANPGFISFKYAKAAQARYYKERPAIALYRERIEKEVRSSRTVVNPFGLKRIFFGALSDNIKSAYNYPIQSGAAHVINTACIRLSRQGLTTGLILQIHDALGFELPNHPTTPQRLKDIRKVMEMPVTIRGRKVDLPVDLKYGKNWDALDKWKWS